MLLILLNVNIQQKTIKKVILYIKNNKKFVYGGTYGRLL